MGLQNVSNRLVIDKVFAKNEAVRGVPCRWDEAVARSFVHDMSRHVVQLGDIA
jgi:hypothetical protein